MIITDSELDGWDYVAEAGSIVDASEFKDSTIKHMFNKDSRGGDLLPWSKCAEFFRFRPGEVTLWSGFNFTGKSMMTSQVVLSMLDKRKALMASFEMSPEAQLQRLIKQAGGIEDPSEGYSGEVLEWLQGRLWIYNHRGSIQPRRVLAAGFYAAKEIGCSHYVVDSLMKISIGSDDMNGYKEFLNALAGMAQQTGLHVHLIAHQKKPMAGSHPDRWGIKGPSEISDQADNIFIVDRKDEPKEGEPTTWLTLDKQRHAEHYEKATKKFGLWFHPSGQFLGNERQSAEVYV